MKFRLEMDNGEIEYMHQARVIEYAKNLKESNPDCPRRLRVRDLLEAIEVIKWAGEFLYDVSDEEYYIALAKNELGSAVRDNSRDQLIEIGKLIELGEWES